MQIEKFKIWKLLYQLNLSPKNIAEKNIAIIVKAGCFHYEDFQIFDFPSNQSCLPKSSKSGKRKLTVSRLA